jgi:hypothetical protein
LRLRPGTGIFHQQAKISERASGTHAAKEFGAIERQFRVAATRKPVSVPQGVESIVIIVTAAADH